MYILNKYFATHRISLLAPGRQFMCYNIDSENFFSEAIGDS